MHQGIDSNSHGYSLSYEYLKHIYEIYQFGYFCNYDNFFNDYNQNEDNYDACHKQGFVQVESTSILVFPIQISNSALQ